MTDDVVQVIHQEWDGHLQPRATFLRNGRTLAPGSRLGQNDARSIVGLHSPATGRVGFADINRQKLCSVAVAAFQILEDPKLGSKRSSGETAEDQDDRFMA